MNKSAIKDFTKGNITSQLVHFAWPLLLSNILQVLYSMVDMIIVGKVIGDVGTSAVTIGGDVTNLLTFVGIGFGSAGQVLIARYIGAGEKKKIGKFIGTMSSFLFVCAVVFSALGLVFQKPLLSLMNTPEEAYEGALAYSTICIAGLVFIYGYNVVSAILRGMGDSKHPLLFIGVATVMNIILDIIFVDKMQLGAAGAAYATIISQAVSFISCTIFLVKNKKRFELDVSKKDFIRWDREMLIAFNKLGIPMAIRFAAVQVSKLFVNSWINAYGLAVSAFAGIANKLAMFVNQFSNAMNTAGATMVGQNIVAGEEKRVADILKRLFIITISIVAVFTAAIIIFPEEIFGWFAKEGDTSVLTFARPFVPIAIVNFVASSLRSTMSALINGSGHTAINFSSAILDGIVMRIGLALLLGIGFGMEYYGFWLGDAIAGYTPFFIGIVFYFSGKWKKPKKKTLPETD